MWKLVALAGLIAAEPQEIGSIDFLSEEECRLEAASFTTEFIKEGWTYDVQLSTLAEGIVIDNGMHRIAVWCETVPSVSL
jgi:hypothetical protein